MSLNFAVLREVGFAAPLHLNVMQDTGNRLAAAVDPNDSVRLPDHYSFDVRFFYQD
jgi:UDP-N-acetyl-2-amino-2-deoxyglucuronate dehydrogenase